MIDLHKETPETPLVYMDDPQPGSQAERKAMRQMMKNVKRGRGRRGVYLAIAAVGLALLIGTVIFGFRGANILEDSRAMTTPVTRPTLLPTGPAARPHQELK